MTQLGEPLPLELRQIRDVLSGILSTHDMVLLDADSVTTGKDFLHKIWDLILSVPLGIAIIHPDMKTTAIANVFYELGIVQALGKESLVIRASGAAIPSDFVRTEYISYDRHFTRRLNGFLDTVFHKADYYREMADLLERNPLLSMDYLRRAYLITGDETTKARMLEVFDSAGLEGRARNSVESLFVKI
jgi:hypothetical protein